MERRGLDEVLAALGGGPVVAAGDLSLGVATTPAQPGTEAGIAIARIDAEPQLEVVGLLYDALRVGGSALLMAPHGGLLGKLGAARLAPELATIAEALLAAGFVEIGAACTPGTLKRELLVWATKQER